MTVLSQTTIKPPTDWKPFEVASTVLWQEILGDRRLHLYGRSGQTQYGLDLSGYQDLDPSRLVGIQCKCKKPGEKVTETELRDEFGKAIGHHPNLSEYILTTTAPDDRVISDVAMKITAEQAKLGRRVLVRVWGWETLQTEIHRHERALLAFDPTYSAFGARTNERLDTLVAGQELDRALAARQSMNVESVLGEIKAIVSVSGGLDATEQVVRAVEAQLDEEIDQYRDRELNGGRPGSALARLENLWERLKEGTSPRIRFRVRALIGHCHLRLGDDERAAEELMAAAEFAENDPKALANKVLALTLLRRFPEAVALGETCLAKDPTDETIAAYLVQAASFQGDSNPLARVPSALHETDLVQRHALAHHRSRGDGVAWRAMARDARRRLPDDDFYVQMAAEADLTEAIEALDKIGWELEPSAKAALGIAAADLARLWDKAVASEETANEESLAICHNAAAAALGSGDAKGAARLVRAGLSIAPDNDSLLLKAASIALETGDADWAREVYPKLGGTGHQLLVKVQVAARLGEYDFLSRLTKADLDTVPAAERPSVEVMVEVAKTRVSPVSGPAAAALVQRLREGPGRSSVRSMVLVSRLAADIGLAGQAEDTYEAAMAMVVEDTHPADRIMLALMAHRRHDLFSVVWLLDGRLGDRADDDSRRILADAHAYVQPPLAGGPAYFSSLPADFRDLDPVIHLEGAMQFNRGDPAAAEERYRILIARHPQEIDPILKVAQCMLRVGRKEDIPAFVQGVERTRLNGTTSDRMTFAQLLLMAGLPDAALEFGYRTLRTNRDDPDVNARWVGLAFAAGLDRYAENAPTAGIGTYVETLSEQGETNAFLIEDGPDRPVEGVISPSHPSASAVLGHGPGYGYVFEPPFGPPVGWSITRVLHAYVHAFHDVQEHFAKRFPGHKGFWRFSMRDGDIGPILEEIRKTSDHRDRVFDGYAEGALPMNALATAAGGSISFAATLAATGRDVTTCAGFGIERKHAFSAVRRGRLRGAVLDTHCAWTVLGLDAMDILVSMFPRVLVARTTIDELRRMREDLADGRPGGTASYLNGQFRFEERTEEGRLDTLGTLKERLDVLSSNCEVIAAQAPLTLDRHAHSLLSNLGFGVMDAALVAREHGMLHLTEDGASRSLASLVLGVEGAWLQVVFLVARNKGLITRQRYARLLVQLAARRHAYVSLDAEAIELAARDPDPRFREGVAMLARYLGTPSADIRSHMLVVMSAIQRLWGAGQNDLDAMRATSILLEALSRHPDIDAKALANFVVNWTEGPPSLRAYAHAWSRGHFLG